MIPITRPDLPPLADYTRLLEEVWSSRMLSNFGRFSRELEAIAADYLGVPTRVVVSGDIGLVLAIAALRIPAGSFCLVPSFTFNSTVNAVLWNDLVPVFADIDAATLNVDPADARRKVAATGAKLVVATHVFGNPADTDALETLAHEQGARVVFDAAHAYGSERAGVRAGGFGDAEVFSLSGTKVVTCAEGGLIASRDEDLLGSIDYYRAYGFQHDYESRCVGLNGKMSELHAALGTLTLPRIDEVLERRHAGVARYRAVLAGCPRVRFQQIRAEDRTSYKDLVLLFEDEKGRRVAEDALGAAGVQTKRYFRPCHRMAAYRAFALDPLPVTDDVHRRALAVPLFADLDDRSIDRIAGIVAAALDGIPAGV